MAERYSDRDVTCDFCGKDNGRLITRHTRSYDEVVAICARCKGKQAKGEE